MAAAGALRCQGDLGKSSIIHLFLTCDHSSKTITYLFTGVSSDVAFKKPLPGESLVAVGADAVEGDLRASADVVLVFGEARSDEFAVNTGEGLSGAGRVGR